MNARSRKIVKAQEDRVYLNMADAFIKISILVADDIWGVTPEDTAKFVRGFEECVAGYGEEGIAKIDDELAERGIEVNITDHRKGKGGTKI